MLASSPCPRLSPDSCVSRRLEGMNSAWRRDRSCSAGTVSGVMVMGAPNTACHSCVNSSSPVDGAFRISFSKERSSLSASSCSCVPVSRSLVPASTQRQLALIEVTGARHITGAGCTKDKFSCQESLEILTYYTNTDSNTASWYWPFSRYTHRWQVWLSSYIWGWWGRQEDRKQTTTHTNTQKGYWMCNTHMMRVSNKEVGTVCVCVWGGGGGILVLEEKKTLSDQVDKVCCLLSCMARYTPPAQSVFIYILLGFFFLSFFLFFFWHINMKGGGGGADMKKATTKQTTWGESEVGKEKNQQ